MHKYVAALIGGVSTGMDPVGTLAGQFNNSRWFFGHIADKYGLEALYRISDMYTDDDVMITERPITRDVFEQALKGVGDCAGLLLNVVSAGGAQLYSLGVALMNYNDRQVVLKPRAQKVR